MWNYVTLPDDYPMKNDLNKPTEMKKPLNGDGWARFRITGIDAALKPVTGSLVFLDRGPIIPLNKR